MNVAVAEPFRRLNAEIVRRRAVKRRAATSLAGVAATVLVISIGAAVAVVATASGRGPASHAGQLSSGRLSSGRLSSGPLPFRPLPFEPRPSGQPSFGPVPFGPLPSGAPRFYIEQGQNQYGYPTKTVVRATASGAVTSTVACPWPRARVVITSIVPADDQEFFMVCERFQGQILGSAVAESRIYRFGLTSAGRVGGYALVRGGVLNGLQVDDIAVTPDGSEAAVDLDSASRFVLNVIVIDTRTGAHAVWHGASRVPGKIIYPILNQGLSFTANGQELAFFTRPQCVQGKKVPPCPVYGEEEVRAVRHPASGGKLSNSRLLLSLLVPMRAGSALISPDGRTVIATESSAFLGYSSIVRLSVATGKQVGVLFREHTGHSFTNWWFSSDPSRRFFILISGPSFRRLVNGGIGNGRLSRLKPSGDDVYQEAW